MRPEVLAVRTVNEYRRRDVVAYLGLRYYLENICAQSNLWVEEVSTHLVNTRVSPVYFRSYHFKEIGETGDVVHRNIYIPGPNEALAEAALLNECSKHSSFKSSDFVFSYKFATQDNKVGIFQSYFPGFQNRHSFIAERCKSLNNSKVLYTDIKKFYPSISAELAQKVWKTACDASSISSQFRELGERLLSEHNNAATAKNEKAKILTGPMLSHLIANLVLAEVDNAMYEKMGGNYARYVDDIVLIGSEDEVKNGREFLKNQLENLGFSLHEDGKDFIVDSDVWLDGANDFSNSESKESKAWIRLIGNIKHFLIAKPDYREQLVNAFLDNGINIPLLNYSNAIKGTSYLEQFLDWLNYRWARGSLRALSVNGLVRDALQTREIYQSKMNTLLNNDTNVKGYERKRLIPKLRFYAGRLTYLAAPDALAAMSSVLDSYPELLLQSKVMGAIKDRDISAVIKFGSNAAQAAAQIIRIQPGSVACSLESFNEIELQGLAIFRLNGLEINFTNDVMNQTIADPINRFALGITPSELMKSSDPFIKEIACLRGSERELSHSFLLDTAFDKDEKLFFDVINQLHGSSSF